MTLPIKANLTGAAAENEARRHLLQV